MTNRIYLRGQQDATDNSVFWQDNTANDDAAYQEGQPVDFGSSGAGLMPTGAVPVAMPTTQTLYLTEAGNTTAVSVNDINQGQLADCFLLSSFGEEALFHQAAITKMIHDNGNGTETVSLYVDRNGRLPDFSSTSFKSTAVTINSSFSGSSVNNGAKQDVVGKLKEIWPQVVEKAVATLGGGINSIANGGYPVIAMEELTGHVATFTSPGSLTLAALTADIAAGDLIVMETSTRGWLPYGLVSDHAYMFEKLNGSGGSATVQLRNPWGFDQPAAIPFAKLAQSGIVNIDIGHTS